MDLFTQLVERAKANKQRIVLPEGTEERTLKAADRILAEDIADLTIIGNTAEIQKLASDWGLQHINKATILDPETNPKKEEYAQHGDSQVDASDFKGLAKQIQRHLAGLRIALGSDDTDDQGTEDRCAFGEDIIKSEVFAGILIRDDPGVVASGK